MKAEKQNIAKPEILTRENKILLIGGPNVGKSVFFTYLTDVYAESSNYSGTTVAFMEGDLDLNLEKQYFLIDVPGTYSLSANSEAEQIAVEFINSDPEAVIFVLDAANLEGSLRLALEIQALNIPTVYALNMVDVAERKGIKVDSELLGELLNAPIIETVAVKKTGFEEVKAALRGLLENDNSDITTKKFEQDYEQDPKQFEQKNKKFWEEAIGITNRVTTEIEKTPNFLDRLSDKMIQPWPGILIALFVILLSLGAIVGGGKALRSVLLLPLVNNVIVPFFERIFTALLDPGILRNILIGEYGIFVISFEWILALITPYVFLFYVVFSFLEDSGFLPRLAVLGDNVMRKLGVQGGSLINVMLGFGCSVPAIIGTRTATTYKERLVVSTMICFAIPCISQTGALISLAGSYSFLLLLGVALVAFVVFVLSGFISSKLVKGTVQPLITDVPNILIPEKSSYFTKVKAQMKSFLKEAEGPMLLAVFIAAIVKETGMLNSIAGALEPIMVNWLGMPEEAVIALVLGIVRREMAVAPLVAMNLTPLQMFVGAVVALLYIPCVSVFGILAKEFNVKTAVTITVSTIVTAILVGGIINQVGLLLIA